jgi:hypothetical protein
MYALDELSQRNAYASASKAAAAAQSERRLFLNAGAASHRGRTWARLWAQARARGPASAKAGRPFGPCIFSTRGPRFNPRQIAGHVAECVAQGALP